MSTNSMYITETHDIKELRIKVQKEINTYMTYSLPLCAVLKDENMYSWLYEHFIQIYALKDNNGGIWVDYLEDRIFYRDIAEYSIIQAKAMENEGSIIDFIIDKINQGYYVITFIDEFYLPNKIPYGVEHNIHQIMLYGYNNVEGKFNTVSFDNQYDFTAYSYKYDQIESAYEKGKLLYSADMPWLQNETVELIKPKNMEAPYHSRLDIILDDIRKYKCGEDGNARIRPFNLAFGEKASFGRAVMEDIIEYLKYWDKSKASVDYRYIHLLCEHKLLMFKRLKHIYALCNNDKAINRAIEEYSQIAEKSNILRVLFLKETLVENNFRTIFQPVKNRDAINKLTDITDYIKQNEVKILDEIMGTLMNYI